MATLTFPDPYTRPPNDAAARRSPRAPAGVVSWGLVLAGAAGALAVSLVLGVLGVATGLSMLISVTNDATISASQLAASAVTWLVVMQFAASAFGGYLTGWARHKTGAAITGEPRGRDGLHGLLAWAVASLVAAVVLASAIAALWTVLAPVRAAAGPSVLWFLASLVAGAAVAFGAAELARRRPLA